MTYKNFLLWLPGVLFIIASVNLSANNLNISNVTVTGQNTTDDYILVEFDISWDNSFRNSTNFDAAWVFIKYHKNDGIWRHATLSTIFAHTAPFGSEIFGNEAGAFIRRADYDTGTISFIDIQLNWDYGSDGIDDKETVIVKVFAIEMVRVPKSSFEVGDGSAEHSFYEVGEWPYHSALINTSSVIIESHGDNNFDDAQLRETGIGVDGDNGIDNDYNGVFITIDNADYPTGYNSFYCMKYEITQEQYVDFLNTLTRDQQDTRTAADLSSGTTSVTNRYVMSNTSTMSNRNGIRIDASIHASDPLTFYNDFDGDGTGGESNDGQNIACNFISWADGAAYADWAGLRPMTELEFEKACRGDQAAVANEYAWGTADRATSAYTLSNEGSADEGIATNYSTVVGNLSVYATNTIINGPLRVGIFAANGSNSGRVTSGSTYYGIMEMSGNLREHAVTLGNSTGRAFTGLCGDGILDANGDADVTNWPGTDGVGVAFRGGGGSQNASFHQVSDRQQAGGSSSSGRTAYTGFRLVWSEN